MDEPLTSPRAASHLCRGLRDDHAARQLLFAKLGLKGPNCRHLRINATSQARANEPHVARSGDFGYHQRYLQTASCCYTSATSVAIF